MGANIGTYAIPLARLAGPRGCVVAFEPHRPTRACLRQNVRRNRLTNVVVVPAAAGERAGAAHLVPATNLGEVHLAPGSARTGLPPTPVTTIDAEVDRLALPRIDFIKLDVEGFELAALRGAARTLADNPDLVVQTEIVPAHAARYGFAVADLIRFFAGYGFHPSACDHKGRLHPVGETAAGDEADWFWTRRDQQSPFHQYG